MPVIKLNDEIWSVSETVGNYIDELVDTRNSCLRKFESIRKITKEWLESDRNTIDKTIEKVGFSLIDDLANSV